MTEGEKEQLVQLLIERMEQLSDEEMEDILLEAVALGRLVGDTTLGEVALVLGQEVIARGERT